MACLFSFLVKIIVFLSHMSPSNFILTDIEIPFLELPNITKIT